MLRTITNNVLVWWQSQGVISRLLQAVDSLWKRASPSIPGTQRYRRRYREVIVKRAKQRLKKFNELEILNEVTKTRLVTKVRHYENQLSIIDSWQIYIGRAIINTQVNVILWTSILGPPIIIGLWLKPGYPIISWVGLYFLQLYCTLLAVIIMLLPLITLPRAGRLFLTIQSTWLISVALAYATSLYRLLVVARTTNFSLITFGAASSLAAALLFFIGYGFIRMTEKAINYKVHREKTLHPDAIMIDGLITLLFLVEKRPADWTKLAFKRRIIRELENIAICIQNDLPGQLSAYDEVTDVWLTEEVSWIAASFRKKKKWILTPKSDTRNQFMREIANEFIYVASGEWDKLGRSEPERVPRSQKSLSRIKGILSGLFMGFTPVIILLIIQQTPLAIMGPIAEYLTVGVIIWASLSMLAIFDPHYSDKISSLSTITNLIPGLKKANNP